MFRITEGEQAAGLLKLAKSRQLKMLKQLVLDLKSYHVDVVALKNGIFVLLEGSDLPHQVRVLLVNEKTLEDVERQNFLNQFIRSDCLGCTHRVDLEQLELSEDSLLLLDQRLQRGCFVFFLFE